MENCPPLSFENIWKANLNEKFSNPEPAKTSKDIKVAIVGAGPAGLVAAYELLKRFPVKPEEPENKQIKIDIFEETQRVGGRVLTVGKIGSGEAGPGIADPWVNDSLEKPTYGEAGAMRLPLIPDILAKDKWNIAELSDDQINDLVHGKEVSNQKAKDADFPMPLMRHYIKELNVPVRRFNMNVAVANVKVLLPKSTDKESNIRWFEQTFVRDEEKACLVGTTDEYKGISLDDAIIQFLQEDQEMRDWMVRRGVRVGDKGKNLHDVFDEDLTHKAARSLTGKKIDNSLDNYLSWITNETWSQFLKDWDKTSKEHLSSMGWPERLINFYGSVYRTDMRAKVNTTIIEDELGHWWQPNMFTLKYGMHSLYDSPHPDKFKGMYQVLRESGRVKMLMGQRVIAITKCGQKAEVEAEKKSELEAEVEAKAEAEIKVEVDGAREKTNLYDYVLVTVPVNAIKSIKFTGFDFEAITGVAVPPPGKLNFETMTLAKRLFQFDSAFWENKENNIGGFCMNEHSGFAVVSRNYNEPHLSQFRYSNPEFEGNVIMCYESHKNANLLIPAPDDLVLETMELFHQPASVVRDQAVYKKVDKKGVSRAPWPILMDVSVSEEQIAATQSYCCGNQNPLYFAGDSWSYCPQWQEGALYTSLHAVNRIIDDISEFREEDPFQYLPMKGFL